MTAAQTHHAKGSLFTPHRRRPAPEMLRIGAAEHDEDMGQGSIEEDGNVVDENPDEAHLADAPFFVDELEREGDTTPVRRRQPPPNHCHRPLRRLIRCRSSYTARRCASSMASVRQSTQTSGQKYVFLPRTATKIQFLLHFISRVEVVDDLFPMPDWNHVGRHGQGQALTLRVHHCQKRINN